MASTPFPEVLSYIYLPGLSASLCSDYRRLKSALPSSLDERKDEASGHMEKVPLKVSFKHFDFG